MTDLFVDGHKENLETQPDTPVSECILDLQKRFNVGQKVIARLYLDGVEWIPTAEERFDGKKISDLKSINIKTSHIRELADETAENLIGFCRSMARLSQSLSNESNPEELFERFHSMTEGLATIRESIPSLMSALGVERAKTLENLQDEMAKILNDLLIAFEHYQFDYAKQLLEGPLYNNLQAWADRGLPELRASRDS